MKHICFVHLTSLLHNSHHRKYQILSLIVVNFVTVNMVQGLPAVKWTPENNTKLLQALVIMHAGAIDYKKLAAIFGKLPSYMHQYRSIVA
jgi:hypothetical protein